MSDVYVLGIDMIKFGRFPESSVPTLGSTAALMALDDAGLNIKDIEALFVQVLSIAKEMKLVKLGTVALDGTKVHANASRHSALSYGHAEKLEAQLETEVKALLARAEAADAQPLPEGLSIPEELTRREVRLQGIRDAKAEIESRAAERFAREQAERAQQSYRLPFVARARIRHLEMRDSSPGGSAAAHR